MKYQTIYASLSKDISWKECSVKELRAAFIYEMEFVNYLTPKEIRDAWYFFRAGWQARKEYKNK